MDGYVIAIIVVASLAVIGVGAFLIWKFTRKPAPHSDEGPTAKEILEKSGEQIQFNVRLIGLILVDLQGETERNKLSALRETLRYLSPSLKEEVHAIDEKIKTELEVFKARAQEGKELGDFKPIERLLAERSLYTE